MKGPEYNIPRERTPWPTSLPLPDKFPAPRNFQTDIQYCKWEKGVALLFFVPVGNLSQGNLGSHKEISGRADHAAIGSHTAVFLHKHVSKTCHCAPAPKTGYVTTG